MSPHSTVLRARWVLPIDRPPVSNGWIELRDGRIVRLGTGTAPGPATDLGEVALLPGLVNAHTHLELSWLAGQVPPAASMVEWIRAQLARRASAPPGDDARLAAMHEAAATMRATGTVLVGDVTNSLATPAVLRAAGLGGVVFHELLGFSVADPAAAVRDAWARVDQAASQVAGPAVDGAGAAPALDFSVIAHAPYSVAPALFTEIAHRRRDAPLGVHLGESPEEIAFLRDGAGPFRALLDDLGVWTDQWTAPQCDPIEYLRRLDYLQPGLLAVHGVHLTDTALARLRDAGGAVVTCPRSNEWVGAGLPRVSHFYATGVPVAIGTDSLASSPSLNMFDELAELRRIAPDLTAACLLESATRIGAEVLGAGRDFGTLAPGKRAAIVAVDVPPGVRDVEEYLVSRVPDDAIRRAA